MTNYISLYLGASFEGAPFNDPSMSIIFLAVSLVFYCIIFLRGDKPFNIVFLRPIFKFVGLVAVICCIIFHNRLVELNVYEPLVLLALSVIVFSKHKVEDLLIMKKRAISLFLALFLSITADSILKIIRQEVSEHHQYQFLVLVVVLYLFLFYSLIVSKKKLR